MFGKRKKYKLVLKAFAIAAFASLLFGQDSLLFGQDSPLFGQDSLLFGQDSPHSGTSMDGMWGYRAPATYHVIPSPPKHHHSLNPTSAQSAPAAKLQSRQIDPYAYGWFGAQPSPHWSRQFGNRNAYTQWTLK